MFADHSIQQGPLGAVPYRDPMEKLADVERLRQPEAESALGHKTDFFFARRVGGSCPSSGAYCRPDHRAFTASDQGAQQRATAGASADEGQIALLVAAAAYENAVGLKRHRLSVHGHSRERDAKITGIMEMSGLARRNHFACHRSSLRRERLPIDDQRLIQHSGELLPRLGS